MPKNCGQSKKKLTHYHSIQLTAMKECPGSALEEQRVLSRAKIKPAWKQNDHKKIRPACAQMHRPESAAKTHRNDTHLRENMVRDS